MPNIASIGTYLPCWGTPARQMVGDDEDAITMAVEAGRAGLQAGGGVERVVLVSRDLPLLESSNAAVLLAGLGLDPDLEPAGAAALLTAEDGQRVRTAARVARCLPVRTRNTTGTVHDYGDPPRLPTSGASSGLFALAGMAEGGTTGPLVAVEQASLSGITVSDGVAAVHRREPAARTMPEGVYADGAQIPISLAAYERAFEAKTRWEAGKFADSETLDFPPRFRVSDDGGLATRYELVPLLRVGTVCTETTVHMPMPGLHTPYSLVIVELDDVEVRALHVSRYLHDWPATREHMAMVAVKNHHHGIDNPQARLRFEITVEQASAAPTVVTPFGLYDCAPQSDGAAALVIAAEDVVDRFTDRPVWIRGVGLGLDSVMHQHKPDLTTFPATVRAAKQAFAMAGMTQSDIDVAEVHDFFTGIELISYEDLGFVGRFEGYKLVEAEVTTVGGALPVNPSGGLKAKGHPPGATGVAQCVELFQQLRGEAVNQDDGARIALAHNIGGPTAVSAVTILEGPQTNGS